MVTYNKHTLSLEDLGTLEEQNWVNDQVRPSTACFLKRGACFMLGQVVLNF